MRGGEQVSEDGLDLLSRMVAFDPARRITAAEALQHRYLRLQPAPTPPARLPRPALRHPPPTAAVRLARSSHPRAGTAGQALALALAA